jgi:hypothetical protein
MRTPVFPGQTGILGTRGTDMSIISDKLFLHSIASIIDATLPFNLLFDMVRRLYYFG